MGCGKAEPISDNFKPTSARSCTLNLCANPPVPTLVFGLKQNKICRCFAGGGAFEEVAKLGETVHETAMAQEKLAILNSHKSVQPICFSGSIMAELGLDLLNPLAFGGANPLVAV